MTRPLVFATRNKGKLVELRELLAGIQVLAIDEVGVAVPEVVEDADTFVGNAAKKACEVSAATGLPVLADDSGFEVDALGGAPGVASAHYAAVKRRVADREGHRRVQDAANNALLVDRLRGIADRRARFVSTIVAVRSADDPEPLIAVGRWHLEVLEAPRGEGGFGYDPLVLAPAFGKTVAELAPEVKNRVSHRAQAAERMLALLCDEWRLADASARG